MWVRSLTIPLTWYNVNSSNNIIQFLHTASHLTATIPIGYYSASALATAITTAMNAVDSNWTVTYSSTTFLFTFSNSNGATRTINWQLNPNTAALLGFLPVTSGAIATFSQTGTMMVLPSTPGAQNVVIKSDELCGHFRPTSVFQSKYSTVIEIVAIYGYTNALFLSGATPWGTMITDRPANPRRFWGHSGINYLRDFDIRLEDDRGNPFILNNPTQGWQLELVFEL